MAVPWTKGWAYSCCAHVLPTSRAMPNCNHLARDRTRDAISSLAIVTSMLTSRKTNTRPITVSRTPEPNMPPPIADELRLHQGNRTPRGGSAHPAEHLLQDRAARAH